MAPIENKHRVPKLPTQNIYEIDLYEQTKIVYLVH